MTIKRLLRSAQQVAALENTEYHGKVVANDVPLFVYRNPSVNDIDKIFQNSFNRAAIIKIYANGAMIALPADNLGYNDSEGYANRILQLSGISISNPIVTLKLSDDILIILMNDSADIGSIFYALKRFHDSEIGKFYSEYITVTIRLGNKIKQTTLEDILESFEIGLLAGTAAMSSGKDMSPQQRIKILKMIVETPAFNHLKGDIMKAIEIHDQPYSLNVEEVLDIFKRLGAKVTSKMSGGQHRVILFPDGSKFGISYNDRKTFDPGSTKRALEALFEYLTKAIAEQINNQLLASRRIRRLKYIRGVINGKINKKG